MGWQDSKKNIEYFTLIINLSRPFSLNQVKEASF